MRRGLIAIALLLAACSRDAPKKSFILATTTTVQGSGVLPMLQVEFKRDTGIEIHPIVAGSGRALDLAAQGNADVRSRMIRARRNVSSPRTSRGSISSSCGTTS